MPCSAGQLGDGLDVRGDGGYIVAAPSIHPGTGRAYVWDDHPNETPLAELPGWLLERAAPTEHARVPVTEWRELARDEAAPKGSATTTARGSPATCSPAASTRKWSRT